MSVISFSLVTINIRMLRFWILLESLNVTDGNESRLWHVVLTFVKVSDFTENECINTMRSVVELLTLRIQ